MLVEVVDAAAAAAGWIPVAGEVLPIVAAGAVSVFEPCPAGYPSALTGCRIAVVSLVGVVVEAWAWSDQESLPVPVDPDELPGRLAAFAPF